MNGQDEKFVMVIDADLPTGIIANTAAILGVTMGKMRPEVVGREVVDMSGNQHLGIIEFPVPILKATGAMIRELRAKLFQPDYEELTVVDFSDLAQSCKTYEEFIGKMAAADEKSLAYFGIGICGSKKKVNKLTGSIPLLR